MLDSANWHSEWLNYSRESWLLARYEKNADKQENVLPADGAGWPAEARWRCTVVDRQAGACKGYILQLEQGQPGVAGLVVLTWERRNCDWHSDLCRYSSMNTNALQLEEGLDWSGAGGWPRALDAWVPRDNYSITELGQIRNVFNAKCHRWWHVVAGRSVRYFWHWVCYSLPFSTTSSTSSSSCYHTPSRHFRSSLPRTKIFVFSLLMRLPVNKDDY